MGYVPYPNEAGGSYAHSNLVSPSLPSFPEICPDVCPRGTCVPGGFEGVLTLYLYGERHISYVPRSTTVVNRFPDSTFH